MDEANGAASQSGDAGRISDRSAWRDVSKHRFAEPHLIPSSLLGPLATISGVPYPPRLLEVRIGIHRNATSLSSLGKGSCTVTMALDVGIPRWKTDYKSCRSCFEDHRPV